MNTIFGLNTITTAQRGIAAWDAGLTDAVQAAAKTLDLRAAVAMPRPEASRFCVTAPSSATPWLVTRPYNGGFVRWRVQSGRGFAPPSSTQQLVGYLSLVVNGHDQAWLHGCANRAREWERSFPIEGTSQEPRVRLPSCWPYL